MGLPLVDDINSPHAPVDSFATLDLTIDNDMQRMSTSRAFLSRDVALKRMEHLIVCPKSVVSRLEFCTDTTDDCTQKGLERIKGYISSPPIEASQSCSGP